MQRHLNFLLIDDDEICLFIHKRVLELSGYGDHVRVAHNGSHALEVLQGSNTLPDIILLDLDMPVMNGIQFLDAFRNLDLPGKERVEIVVVTSSVSERDRRQAMVHGVSKYITKPLTQENLESIVHPEVGIRQTQVGKHKHELKK